MSFPPCEGFETLAGLIVLRSNFGKLEFERSREWEHLIFFEKDDSKIPFAACFLQKNHHVQFVLLFCPM